MTKSKTIKFKKLLQVLVLLVFTINWFNAANASFLCVCSDGHTSIESIYSSDCHQIELEINNNVGTQISPQEGCHDCQDVSLSSDGINSDFNHFKNFQVQNTQNLNNFIQINIATLVKDQFAPLIHTDNKPRIFTDSIRLII